MSADLTSLVSELGPWPTEKPRVNETPAGDWVTHEPAHHCTDSVSPRWSGGSGANIGGSHVTDAQTAHTVIAGPVITPVPAQLPVCQFSLPSEKPRASRMSPSAHAVRTPVAAPSASWPASTISAIPSLSLMQTQVDGQLAGSAPFLLAPPALSGARNDAPAQISDRFPSAGERDFRAISLRASRPRHAGGVLGPSDVVTVQTRPLRFLALLSFPAVERFVRAVVQSLRHPFLHGQNHAGGIEGCPEIAFPRAEIGVPK